MITRRNFLKTLSLVPVIIAAGKVRISLVSEPKPHHWYGIPYHSSNGTTGIWLGIDRASYHPIAVKKYNELMHSDWRLS